MSARDGVFRLVRIGSRSLRNHIIFIFVVVSLPTTAMFALSSYQDGELTPLWMLRIFAVSTITGLILALVGWYVILPPILRRSDRDKH